MREGLEYLREGLRVFKRKGKVYLRGDAYKKN